MGEEDERAPEDAAEQRQHEMARRTEETLAGVREDLGEQTYPASAEEVAAMYADQPSDLPNETEWVATALERIDTSFEDEQAAYEALVTVFEEGQHVGIRSDAKGPEPPYQDAGAETQRTPGEEREAVDSEQDESTVKTSKEHARRDLREEESPEDEER